jgi:hypothetical protein
MGAREIRADFDDSSIVVYQTCDPEIAGQAVEQGRFLPPYAGNRMWITSSFGWIMSGYRHGRRPNPAKERILAVRITRTGWEEALSVAIPTRPDLGPYAGAPEWRARFEQATVRIQWEPGTALLALSGSSLDRYAVDWTVAIEDRTSVVRKIHRLRLEGKGTRARNLYPAERVYPVTPEIARQIGS